MYLLQQSKLREVVEKSCVPQQFKAHRDQFPLYQGYVTERSSKSLVATEEEIADVLTKPLVRVNFYYFRERLGVIQIEIPQKRE